MVPIHDTDLAEERWSQATWENYELWEKIEIKLKRQQRLWVLATVFVFMVLSAIPIVMDRWPKWGSRSLTRKLALEVNRIKREAISNRIAFRLKFIENGKLNYVVDKVATCAAAEGETIRTGTLETRIAKNGSHLWISPSVGMEFQLPGLVNEFCYDPLQGSGLTQDKQAVVGFGIVSVKDLTEKRFDRLSLLLLTGPSAEISFD